MSANVVNGRWTARKGQGHFVARADLSASQQTLLAAVPRWKRAWVRPASLKPNQSPNFKVLKWVLDTGAQKEEGTSEEMEAALKVVVSGQAEGLDGEGGEGENGTEGGDENEGEVDGLTPIPTSAFASGTATPALMENTSEGESAADSSMSLDILPGAITPSLTSTAGPSKLATETFPSEVNSPSNSTDLPTDSGPPSAAPASPLLPNLALPPNPHPAPAEEAVEGLKDVPVDAIDVEMGNGEGEAPFVEDELQLAAEALPPATMHEA